MGPGELHRSLVGDALTRLGEGVERLQVFFGQFLPQHDAGLIGSDHYFLSHGLYRSLL